MSDIRSSGNEAVQHLVRVSRMAYAMGGVTHLRWQANLEPVLTAK